MATGFHFDNARHEYTQNGIVVPHVTGIMAAAGKCPWQYVDEDLKLHSLQRGQSVHWMTQLEDEHALNYRTVPKRLRGYRQAWLEWKRASGFIPIWIERKFVSRYGFAGTIDRIGSFPPTSLYGNATTGVVDLKTGAIQEFTRLQLAAYSLGVEDRFQFARNIRRVAVRLRSDGKYNVAEWPRKTWDRDIAEFLADLKETQCRK